MSVRYCDNWVKGSTMGCYLAFRSNGMTLVLPSFHFAVSGEVDLLGILLRYIPRNNGIATKTKPL